MVFGVKKKKKKKVKKKSLIIGSGDPLESGFRADLASSGAYLSSLRKGQASHGPPLLFTEGPPITQE